MNDTTNMKLQVLQAAQTWAKLKGYGAITGIHFHDDQFGAWVTESEAIGESGFKQSIKLAATLEESLSWLNSQLAEITKKTNSEAEGRTVIITPGLFLVSWVFPTENIPLCLCESVEDAGIVVKEKLGFEPEWNDSLVFNKPLIVSMWYAPLNIVHDGSTLQGVMIQQVPIYKVEHAV